MDKLEFYILVYQSRLVKKSYLLQHPSEEMIPEHLWQQEKIPDHNTFVSASQKTGGEGINPLNRSHSSLLQSCTPTQTLNMTKHGIEHNSLSKSSMVCTLWGVLINIQKHPYINLKFSITDILLSERSMRSSETCGSLIEEKSFSQKPHEAASSTYYSQHSIISVLLSSIVATTKLIVKWVAWIYQSMTLICILQGVVSILQDSMIFVRIKLPYKSKVVMSYPFWSNSIA